MFVSSASSASTVSATFSARPLHAARRARAPPANEMLRGLGGKEHEADHVGARIERDIERFGRREAADFDQKRHGGRGSSATFAARSNQRLKPSDRHTSIAAARSSIAVPTDLNSVIWLAVRAALGLAAAEFEQVAADAVLLQHARFQRLRDVAAPPSARRRGCRHRRARACTASSSASRIFGV